jgi:hypothetical protein
MVKAQSSASARILPDMPEGRDVRCDLGIVMVNSFSRGGRDDRGSRSSNVHPKARQVPPLKFEIL